MKTLEVIQALAAQGIEATESQVLQLTGGNEVTQSDIPYLVDLLPESTRQSTLAVATPNQNQVVLPNVSELKGGEVEAWIQQLESDPSAQTDDVLIQTLCDLYDAKDRLIALAKQTTQTLGQQDQELVAAVGGMQASIAGSLELLGIVNSNLKEMAGGSRLGDSFRQRSNAFDRFTAHLASKSANGRTD